MDQAFPAKPAKATVTPTTFTAPGDKSVQTRRVGGQARAVTRVDDDDDDFQLTSYANGCCKPPMHTYSLQMGRCIWVLVYGSDYSLTNPCGLLAF
eukprot:scaffold202648_cov41-Tisochrysis_lutea.AAC.1